MELVEDITLNMDDNIKTAGVFIYFKKAFDSIDHTILIRNLSHYGIRGIALIWLENYLSQRNQYVQFNDAKSDLKTMLCGIPQGSILGPILFILYINDLANISDKLKFILFADDTNVFYSDNDLNKVFNVINDELKHLCIYGSRLTNYL